MAVFCDFEGQDLVFWRKQGDHRVERVEFDLEPLMRAPETTSRQILTGKTGILPLKSPT